MNRLLSLAASAMLLALVVTSGALPGSLPYVPLRPTARSPQDHMEAANRAVPSTTGTTGAAPDTLLIKLRPKLLPGEPTFDQPSDAIVIPRMFAAFGVRSAEPVFPRAAGAPNPQMVTPGIANLRQIYRLRLAPGTDPEWAVAALRVNPLVAFAEPDYQAHSIITPADPRYAEQWALAKINAPAAWDVTTGSGNVVVAVIDSGIDTTHSDLSGQLWTNPGELAGNGIDDDNNGHVDDINGWNFLGNNADLGDTTGHGTQVAGVLAAAANNSIGGAGICWGCKLMIVKVTQSGGIANYSDIAAGVLYAAQKGAKVINLSLGGTSDSATLRAAILVAAQTAVIVGGAGNSNSAALFYPAAYDESVLAVAGTTQADTKVATSNYGAWADVSAPGENILTTFSGGTYGAASGTSVAAPFAAGLAGLLLSQHPDWSPAQVRAQIVNTATSIDSLNPGLVGQLGSGRINAAQALTIPATPALVLAGYAVNGQPAGRPEPGSTVDLLVTLANRWNNTANVQATLSGAVIISQPSGSFGTITAFKSGTNTAAFRFTAAAGYNMPMSFTLNLTADGGYAITLPLTIVTSPGITNVSATIATQTWSADRTYMINQDSGVPAGATLTIQPGTVVRFAPNTSLIIAGTLIADAPAAQPIRFTRQGTAGNGGQIKFLDSSIDASFDGSESYTGGSILRGAIVEYGQGVNLATASPYIASSTFSNITSGTMMPGTSGSAISGNPSAGFVVADNHFLNAGVNLQPMGSLTFTHNTLDQASINFSAGDRVIISDNLITATRMSGSMIGTSEAIYATGTVTITNNRIIGGVTVIAALGGRISGNLIANSEGNGLTLKVGMNWSGSPTNAVTTVANNTLIGNKASGISVALVSQMPGAPYSNVALHTNNLIAAPGTYALRLANDYIQHIDATGNWWGTTDPAVIQAAIYDGHTEYGIGMVDASGALSEPGSSTSAYVRNVTISPDATLGIQQATIDVQFSRPMNQSTDPAVSFHDARRETWTKLPAPDPQSNFYNAIAVDRDGSVWAGLSQGLAHFNGTTWKTYTTLDYSQPIGMVSAITIDSDGTKWLGTMSGLTSFDGTTWRRYPATLNLSINSIAIDKDGSKWIAFSTGPNNGSSVGRLSGTTWTLYNQSNSGLPARNISAIAIDQAGVKWFAANGTPTGPGVIRFDGSTWTSYNMSNSGLPGNNVSKIGVDLDGSVWFVTGASGVVRFDGTNWITYNPSISSMAVGFITIAVGSDGTKWFGTSGGIVRFDGMTWTSFSPSSTGSIMALAVDADGNAWSGVSDADDGGLYVLWHGRAFPITNNAQWLDDHTWRATYDITTLVPRGAQAVSVSGARGGDGREIAPDSRFGFTVDYAGTISDKSPPNPPWLFATGTPGDPSSVRVIWSASDGESGIVAYRYAIGTAPGATDVVNWTTVGTGLAARVAAVTSSAEAGIARTGLGLADGQQYWVSVQAQNSGGLWSTSQYGSFIAGQQSFITLYLPLSQR